MLVLVVGLAGGSSIICLAAVAFLASIPFVLAFYMVAGAVVVLLVPAGGSLAMNLSCFATSLVLFASLARRARVRWQDRVPRRTDLTRPSSSPS